MSRAFRHSFNDEIKFAGRKDGQATLSLRKQCCGNTTKSQGRVGSREALPLGPSEADCSQEPTDPLSSPTHCDISNYISGGFCDLPAVSHPIVFNICHYTNIVFSQILLTLGVLQDPPPKKSIICPSKPFVLSLFLTVV